MIPHPILLPTLRMTRALLLSGAGLAALLLGTGCETTGGGHGHTPYTAGPVKGILLDPGHGGEPSEAAALAGEDVRSLGHTALRGYREECYGAISASGYKEKTANLAVSRKIRTLLDRAGYATALTRDSDKYLTLDDRVSTAMSSPYRDWIFVSIHFNRSMAKQQATKISEKHKSPRGFEIYILPPDGGRSNTGKRASSRYTTVNETRAANRRLAECIRGRLNDIPGMVDRGIKEAWFVVLRGSPMPAVLIEGGFLSNPEEGKLLATEDYQWKYATAVAQGIQDYAARVGGGARPSPSRKAQVPMKGDPGLRDD